MLTFHLTYLVFAIFQFFLAAEFGDMMICKTIFETEQNIRFNGMVIMVLRMLCTYEPFVHFKTYYKDLPCLESLINAKGAKRRVNF